MPLRPRSRDARSRTGDRGMRIKLTYVGYLKLEGAENGSVLEVGDSLCIADLLDGFRMKREHQRYVVPLVNGVRANWSTLLQPEDSLFLYLPVGGG